SLTHRQTHPTLCLPPAQDPIALSTHQQVPARIPHYGKKDNTLPQGKTRAHQSNKKRLPQNVEINAYANNWNNKVPGDIKLLWTETTIEGDACQIDGNISDKREEH